MIGRLKARLHGWMIGRAVRMRPQFGLYLVNKTWPWGRPTLAYLEFHLADHCNLNCAGCLHYAPFADRRFADLETVRKDFARLKTLFANIRHVRIMGGEPLLHPDVVSFARIVREAFPRSRVCIVSNGLLLKSFDGLSELAKLRVGIDWTKYPPVAQQEPVFREMCAKAGVDLQVEAKPTFWARIVPTGGVGIRRSFAWCRRRLYCPFLDSGRIYPCAPARFAPYYNRAAGTKIFAEPGLDIHSASAREILLYLMRPSFACQYCAEGKRTFGWRAGCDPKAWCFEEGKDE